MLSKEELEAYCREYYLPVYKYCMSRLSNKEDAEDATQETFVIFCRKRHILEEEHIKSWLYTTAHHMVLREYKKRSLKNDKEYVFDEQMTELSKKVRTLEDDLVDYYISKYIDDIYARLSIREKELFDLCSDNNLKSGQIAQLLGLDSHTFSMRKLRLKEKCRDIMTEILFY